MKNNLIITLQKSKIKTDREKCIQLLKEHLLQNPNDAESWYDLASCCDFLGLELDAEPNYKKAYELDLGSLPLEKQYSFYVGYGSTLRNNEKLEESEIILKEGISKFPAYQPLKVFLAFTLFSIGKFKESSEMLFLTCGQLPVGTFDGYEKAIKYYSENLAN